MSLLRISLIISPHPFRVDVELTVGSMGFSCLIGGGVGFFSNEASFSTYPKVISCWGRVIADRPF
jgi:hypothetical protein